MTAKIVSWGASRIHGATLEHPQRVRYLAGVRPTRRLAARRVVQEHVLPLRRSHYPHHTPIAAGETQENGVRL
jgi:hypothetical protein